MSASASSKHQSVVATPKATAKASRPALSAAVTGPGEYPPGPAVALQRELEGAFAERTERWSPRRTLSFIGLTCGGFWLGVGYCVWVLTR